MAGKTLDILQLLDPETLAVSISERWRTWNMLRSNKLQEMDEVRRYVFATDTTKTSNSKLPWKNKTTVPKLCQIRDNLYANYMKSLFPKNNWMTWDAYEESADTADKRKAIETYMCWAVSRSDFKREVAKLVLDYIDTGNAFATVEWRDERNQTEVKDQKGYVGPKLVRISPLDIVFNPIAASFDDSPKIIRKFITLGELKEELTRVSTDDNRDANDKLFNYLRQLRLNSSDFTGDLSQKDSMFAVDGFTSFRDYLDSPYVEVLTFYGDLYDVDSDEFYRNYEITVVDRHKIISKKVNPSGFGRPSIWHVGWRVRQDNLWAMGPLDNLVGMQYRIDHLENLKADVFDLVAFPPLKIKGLVEDFEWGPMSRIIVGDDGDVEMIAPDINALNANIEISNLEQKMEEMAGSPKEAMGFRTPGEKTKYEVQRLENAAGRIFLSKIEQFEEQMTEEGLSGMLEMARRMGGTWEVSVFDDDLGIQIWASLTADDITGFGRIKPIAARHFAEQAERVQNLTAFMNSAVGQDPDVKVHWSGLQLSKAFESLLEVEGYHIVTPYVRISEQAEAQQLMNVHQEQTQMMATQPSGLTPDDYSQPAAGVPPGPAPALPQGGLKG